MPGLMASMVATVAAHVPRGVLVELLVQLLSFRG